MTPPGTAGRFDTHDVVEHNEADDLWENILQQMSPGSFHGQVEFVQLNGLLFYREQWNQRILATGTTPKGYFVFGGSLSEESVDWCGASANREQLAFGRPASEMEVIFPGESQHIALLVPDHLMQHYFGEELVADMLSSKSHHLKFNPQHGCDLVTRLDHMVTKYQENVALLADASECKAAERQLMNDLSGSFANFKAQAHHATPIQRRKMLKRAIAFIENLRVPITIPEFATASGMSQRSLELAFQETLGITPRQYLHWHRMNRIHRQLLASDVEATSITRIATHWGFTELGRFAVEYKRLFGESPSVTLMRSKAPPAKRLSDALPG